MFNYGFSRFMNEHTLYKMMRSCHGNPFRSKGPLRGNPWVIGVTTKDQQCGVVVFSLLLAWTRCWKNIRHAGDLRRHYTAVIMSAMASLITDVSIVQAQIKENIKAPRHWPLWGEFTGDRWIPCTKASNAENVSIWWRHHGHGAHVT